MTSAHAQRCGFSLVEALVCVMLLGVFSLIASTFVSAVRNAASVQTRVVALDWASAKLAELESGPLSAGTGIDSVLVRGRQEARRWTVATSDVNGDATPEPDVFRIQVDVAGVKLETLRTTVAGLGTIKR
jgi:prepilin-type N-terminal cleavage/methylation domain-containing protein